MHGSLSAVLTCMHNGFKSTVMCAKDFYRNQKLPSSFDFQHTSRKCSDAENLIEGIIGLSKTNEFNWLLTQTEI